MVIRSSSRNAVPGLSSMRMPRSSRRGGEAEVVQNRDRSPKRGKDKADIAPVVGDPWVVAQHRHAGMVGIHDREQAGHDAKDQV